MELSDDERKAIEVACESISRDERCGPVGLGALCVLQDLLTRASAATVALHVEGEHFVYGTSEATKLAQEKFYKADGATVAEPGADECEHDWGFHLESSDGKTAVFTCHKCGAEKTVSAQSGQRTGVAEAE